MIILSLDPGETTGYAVVEPLDWPNQFPIVHERGVISLWRGLRGLIEEHRPDVIVAEEYRLYPNKAKTQYNDRIMPARVLGVIQSLAEEYSIPHVFQSASVGKAARLPDEVFQRVRTLAHERDALCHAIAYLNAKKGR
jgi:hypothetical protein